MLKAETGQNYETQDGNKVGYVSSMKGSDPGRVSVRYPDLNF